MRSAKKRLLWRADVEGRVWGARRTWMVKVSSWGAMKPMLGPEGTQAATAGPAEDTVLASSGQPAYRMVLSPVSTM